MDEQTQADSPSVEDRLAAYFGAKPEAATPEAPAAPLQPPTGELPTEEASPEAEVPEDDGLDDLDVDGAVYRVPKELKSKVSEWKDGQLRRDDYTRKTQELADLTRQAQLTAEAIQLRDKFEKETQKERDELAGINAEIAKYKQVKWNELETGQLVQLRVQLDDLKAQAAELNGKLGETAKEYQKKFEQNKKDMFSSGLDFLKKKIPDLDKIDKSSLKTAAKDVGYTDDELENVYDARFVALSWKAAQYDKLLTQKSSAVSAVQKAPPVVKPGAVGTGPADRRAKDARDNLKKTGSTDAFARALLAKGMVK